MRAIVTGAAGFIGRWLSKRLLQDGWQVAGIDDGSGGTTGPDWVRVGRVQDIRHPATSWRPDVIFHLAGKVGPVGVIRWKGEIVSDTVAAADMVGQWARGYECPVVDVSTSEVYGDPTGPNSESTPRVFQPGSSARMEYAIGKLAAEMMLRNRDIDVRIVRPFNVAGPGQSSRGGFVLPRFMEQAFAGEPLTVYAPGTQRRAFTHVDDICDGIIRAFTHGKPGEDYNLGNAANECSIMELAEEVVDTIRPRPSIEIVDPKLLHGPDFREAADKVPDASKAMRELGWRPRCDRRTIIEDVAASYMVPA